MASFNKIQIVGFLGRDPELRYTANGTAVADFSIATNERRKGKSGEVEETATWFRIAAFGKQAEFVSQYLNKGSQVFVDGRLSQREYTDKDGNTRHSLEVKADDVQILSAKTATTEAKQPAKTVAVSDDDDCPF